MDASIEEVTEEEGDDGAGWDIFAGSWEAYEAYGEPAIDIEWINTNLDNTVETILKSKKGSIKNAPKKPGDPDWQVILGMTLREIQELTQKGDKGFVEEFINY